MPFCLSRKKALYKYLILYFTLQPLRFGSDLAMPVSVVRDLGINIDLDVSVRSYVIKTTSACFVVLRQIQSLRRSVPRTVLQSLVCKSK